MPAIPAESAIPSAPDAAGAIREDAPAAPPRTAPAARSVDRPLPEFLTAETDEYRAAMAAANAGEDDATPLAVGTRLQDRYEIVEVVESEAGRARYRARDLSLCAACGFEGNPAGEAYCASCGAALNKPFYVAIEEQVPRLPKVFQRRFQDGERDYYVIVEPREPEPEPAPDAAPGRVRLQWAALTDQGVERDHNEDAIDARVYSRANGDLLGLFMVADGLGGQDSGEVASGMTTEAVWEALRQGVWERLLRGEAMSPDDLEAQIVAAARAANVAVYQARTGRGSEMSSTLTLALVVGNAAYVANVGDSRTYLWNAEGLRQVTRDHSLVQRLVDAGQLRAAEVYTHPQRNVIYQCVGDRPEVMVDAYRLTLRPDDRLVLCSDGLWEMVRTEGLEEVLLAEPDPQRAAERLVQNANLAGGEDNISVIIVQVI